MSITNSRFQSPVTAGSSDGAYPPLARNRLRTSPVTNSEGGMQAMIKHVFGTMHEMLDEIMTHYPHADAEQMIRLNENLAVLKQFSDHFIEEWLQFEEKMADFRDLQSGTGQAIQANPQKPALPATMTGCMPDPAAYAPKAADVQPQPACAAETAVTDMEHPADEREGEQAMSKGQGYFKLFMFRQAAGHFQEAVRLSPDDNRARLFLGMTLMHLQDWHEAQRHFELLVQVTDHSKWRALALNALGCIQAVRMNLEQAEHYFHRAHEADPEFADPLTNIESCRQPGDGHLSLYFGSGQL